MVKLTSGEIKESLINSLMSLEVCIPNSMRTQYVIRCPYCGDSRNKSHGHFSIHIDKESDDPILYRCFKCDASGLFTNTTMEDIGMGYDPEFNTAFKSYNNRVSRHNNFS